MAAYVGTLTSSSGAAHNPNLSIIAAGGHRRTSSTSSGSGMPSSTIGGVVVPLAVTALPANGSGAGTPSPITPEDLPSPVNIFLEYVHAVLHVLKPLRRTWVLSNTLYLLFQALELLPKYGRHDKTAALLQKAAIAVPEGMPLLKTVVLTRCLWYSTATTSRKAAIDRRKLIDNTIGLARQIGLENEVQILDQIVSSMNAVNAPRADSKKA